MAVDWMVSCICLPQRMGSIRHGVEALSTARARSLGYGGCWNPGWRKTLETFSPHWKCWFVEGLRIVQAGRQAGSCCCKRNDPGAWCWSTVWINGWSRTGCKCRAGQSRRKQTRKPGSRASRASTVQGEPQRSTRKRDPAATRITRHEGAHCAEKEAISCKVMLGGRTRRPIRRRQEPDANGTGMGRRRQYVRDRAENSLYQPPAFGSRASMEDPCQSQSHTRRMVPYGEKQGRGGSLALFTVLTRDGCCSSGTAIARMAAPKKGKKDVTRDGPSSLDHSQISDIQRIETRKAIQNLEKSTTPRADTLTLANWAH